MIKLSKNKDSDWYNITTEIGNPIKNTPSKVKNSVINFPMDDALLQLLYQH